MRKLLWLVAVVVVVGSTALVRTVRHGLAHPPGVERAIVVAVPERAAERLAGAVRIATVSHDDPDAFDAHAFRRLHAYLETVFPRAHSQLTREVVNDHSLLYTWLGSDPGLMPILLSGHLDVVPVEPGTEPQWQQDPFAGRIVDGHVWGRGAIDNKSAVMGTLEAVEMLLAEGYRPARTVHLAYGHDEERGGTSGAREIAALLKSRDVEFDMVFDEGGVIADGVLPGLAVPVALVGIAEKGFLSVELRTRAPGGHSSLPPRETAIGILSAALARLEENAMPARLEGPTRELLDTIAPRLPFARRAVLANLWLTRPLVLRGLERSPTTNAMVRTTAAATLFHAGTKDNVLPRQARAIVNFWILPGDSTAGVVRHVRRVIGDSRVEVTVAGGFAAEPSAVSSSASASFRMLERAIRGVAPEVVVAPYLVVVVTDARHYAGLTRDVLRFLPLRLEPQDLERIHGTDERIAVDRYEEAIRIYRQLLREAASG